MNFILLGQTSQFREREKKNFWKTIHIQRNVTLATTMPTTTLAMSNIYSSNNNNNTFNKYFKCFKSLLLLLLLLNKCTVLGKVVVVAVVYWLYNQQLHLTLDNDDRFT